MGKPGGKATGRMEPGTAISPRNGQRAVLTQPGERFDPPAHIVRQEALTAWEEYWEDPVSSVVTIADHGLLLRWIDMVQRYWTLLEEADSHAVVETNANGLLAHPLYKVALGIGNQIERLEIKLGIGPKNRAALGIQIIQQKRDAAEFQRAAPGTPAVPSPEEDPRFS